MIENKREACHEMRHVYGVGIGVNKYRVSQDVGKAYFQPSYVGRGYGCSEMIFDLIDAREGPTCRVLINIDVCQNKD